MPTIKTKITATTTDALQGVKFADIGGNGAIVNAWVAGETAGDTFGLSLGNQDIVAAGTLANVGTADTVDMNTDQVVFNEVVPPGHLFLPVGAVTTSITALIHIRYV